MRWTTGISKEVLDRAGKKAGSYYQRDKQIKSRLKLTLFQRVLIFFGFKELVEDILIAKKLRETKNK